MSLLSIAERLALNVGLATPDYVYGSTNRGWREVVTYSQEAALELVRRVDWGELAKTETLTGDGTNKVFTLPSDYDHLTGGVSVMANGEILHGLTAAEWRSLTPEEDDPRFYMVQGNKITLWPYLADGEEATVYYQSDAWAASGGNTWASDEDTSLIDEDLLGLATIVRWRRQKGMDYASYEAELEAELEDRAIFEDRRV
jgi:hypothetical protein